MYTHFCIPLRLYPVTFQRINIRKYLQSAFTSGSYFIFLILMHAVINHGSYAAET
jgi:hypothetical protein